MTSLWQQGTLWPLDDASARAPVVLKIGGSLLSWQGWPQLIETLVVGVEARLHAIVVGGGAIVDGLRTIDNAAPQLPQVMHDLAVDAMHFTARLVAKATGLPICETPPADGSACILDVPMWLLSQGRASDLPASWNVTSDSIAARVAREYGAELLLAKSQPPPQRWCGTSLDTLAKTGWVDRHFPTAATGVSRIEWTAPA